MWNCEICTYFDTKHFLSSLNMCNLCKYQLPESPDPILPNHYFPKLKCKKCNTEVCEAKDFLTRHYLAKLIEIVNKNCNQFELKS